MPGLAPVAQDISICLRCQFRMSGRRAIISKKRGYQQLRHFTPQQRRLQEDEKSLDAIPKNEHFFRYEPIEDKYRGIKHVRIKESLGFDVLGERGEVLVLPDTKARRGLDVWWSYNPEDDPPDTVPTNPLEILDEMKTERGIVDADQVHENIDQLRDEWFAGKSDTIGIIPGSSYDGLATRLLDGFTKGQLIAYLKQGRWRRAVLELDLHKRFNDIDYARSSWIAGTTSLEKTTAPEFGEDVGFSPILKGIEKRKLVDQILRSCWHVRPKQEEALVGELDIRLNSNHIDLILKHRREILKKISEGYDVKIEANRALQVIRITSDFDTSGDILRIFIYMIKNIHTEMVLLPSHNPNRRFQKSLDKKLSEQVGQMTSTIISSSSTNINVTYLGPERTDLEDAKRLIMRALGTHAPKKTRLVWGVHPSKDTIAPAPIDVGSNLPISDRNEQWSRWSSPAVRKVEFGNDQHRFLPQPKTTFNPLDVREDALKAVTNFLNIKAPGVSNYYEVPASIRRYWVPSIYSRSSALLGQVLFPLGVANEANKELNLKANSSGRFKEELGLPRTSRREFLTSVPGMVRSLEFLQAADYSQESLLIRLHPSLPSEEAAPGLTENLPDLELLIRLSRLGEKHDITLGSARLIVAEEELDLLLPENAMDLRFSRQSHVYANTFTPSIRAFVNASNLDVWGQERLQTPTNLPLTIPAHSIPSFETFNQSLFAEGLEVHYTFASLEHRSQLRIPFPSDPATGTQEISYTTIEAGRTGGRRDELAIVHGRRRVREDSTKDGFPKTKLVAMEKHLQSKVDGGKDEKMDPVVAEEQRAEGLFMAANALVGVIESPTGGGKRHTRPDSLRKHLSEGHLSLGRKSG